MSKIEFSPEEKNTIVTKIKRYFNDELDQEIKQFDAEFLLDFFTEEIGVYHYNRGLADAQIAIQTKFEDIFEDISDAIYMLEKDTGIKQ